MVNHKLTRLIIFFIISFMILLSSCSGPTDEGFAIYLTKEEISPSKMEALSHVELADSPIISSEDVISYEAQSHEIKLTDAAYNRILELEVPVHGRSFLVCVDRSPIYWGAFWVNLSSVSFSGVTINKPLSAQESKILLLELGYPSSSFFTGDDPRSNETVMKALDKSGKLINKP